MENKVTKHFDTFSDETGRIHIPKEIDPKNILSVTYKNPESNIYIQASTVSSFFCSSPFTSVPARIWYV